MMYRPTESACRDRYSRALPRMLLELFSFGSIFSSDCIITSMNPAIFLDRDGVIIENVDTYVRAWSDVAILPGSLEALARLKKSEFKIIVVTNQSVVGRGILTLSEAQLINDRL